MSPDRVAAASVAVVLLLLSVAVFRRRRSRDVAARSPITLFALVWAIALGFFAIPWINYSRPSGLAWAAVYGALIAFLVGAFVGERLGRRLGSPPGPERLRLARLRAAVVITALVGYIGFAFFVLTINDIVGWRALFTDLRAAREIQASSRFNEQYGTIRVLTYASGISLLLWTIGLRERAFRGRWRILAPVGFLVLVPYFFLGERISLLTVGMWITAFHLLWRPARSPRTVAAVAVLAVAGALGFFYLIGYQKGATLQNHPQLKSQIRTERFQELIFPYLYLTANVPVLSKSMQDPIAPQTYGALTFWPASKLSNLALRRSDFPPKYGAFYNVPFDGYNSATWLGPFYRDFGLPGCLVMPALFGVFTTWLVTLARRRRTLLTAWIAALGLTIIAFSPLKNAFPDASTWELLIAAPLVSYFMRQRTPRDHPAPRWRILDLQRRPLVFATAIALAVALAAVAGRNRLATAGAHGQTSTQVVSERLVRAGEKVAQIYQREGNGSSPHALATRLEVSDPSTLYHGVYSPGEISAPGVIDVIPGQQEFRLQSRTDRDEVLEVIGVRRGGSYRVTGPRVLAAGLVENGDFEEPVMTPWLMSSHDRVDLKRTSSNALDGAYSLNLRYRRASRGRPSSISQVIADVPARSAGTSYTMNEIVLTQGLSRGVSLGLQLVYRDGTSRYFRGRPSAPSTLNGVGIPAGTAGPLRMTASGIASKSVSSIRVFALDAGAAPLTGVISVDAVRLDVREPSRQK